MGRADPGRSDFARADPGDTLCASVPATSDPPPALTSAADPVQGPAIPTAVGARSSSWRWLALDLLLLALAYRGLVVVDPGGSLPAEFESWFFVPTRSSTPAVVSLALAGWVLWRRRAELRELPASASLAARCAGAVASALSLGVAYWATATGAHDLLVVSLALQGAGCCAWLRGGRGLRVCALPLALLLLALPMPAPLFNELAFSLQLATAQFSGWVLYAFGLPAVVSADQILRAEASFAVIETCSGLRSMETLLTLSLLMAELFQRRGLHTALLLLAAPGVGFLVNGVRVVTLILNPHSEVHSIHNAQGVAVLLAGVLAMYLADGLLERLLPVRAARSADPRPPGRPGTRLLPTAVLAGTWAVTLAVPAWRPVERLTVGLEEIFPAAIDRWRSAELKFDEPYLGSLAFQRRMYRRYFSDSEQVDVFAGLADHDRSRRGPFSSKLAVPGSGWVTEARYETSIGKRKTPVEARICRRRTDRRLVYYWFEGAEGPGSEIWRSALALDQSRWRRRRDALVLRISTPLAGTGSEARHSSEQRLEEFHALLESNLERLDRRYPRKRFSDFLPTGKSLSLAGDLGRK